MEQRRIIFYMAAILGVLLVVLAILASQMQKNRSELKEASGGVEYVPDPVNGSSIYLTGKDLSGRMIPISGGPDWFVLSGGGCAVCHGQNGRGGETVKGLKAIPPDLRKAMKRGFRGISQEEFTTMMRWGERPNGKPLSYEMPRFDLAKKSAADLFAFIKKL